MDRNGSFEAAAKAGRTSIVSEFWQFLAHNKKWWLLPIVLVFVLLGALMLLRGTAAAPFIYTLFSKLRSGAAGGTRRPMPRLPPDVGEAAGENHAGGDEARLFPVVLHVGDG